MYNMNLQDWYASEVRSRAPDLYKFFIENRIPMTIHPDKLLPQETLALVKKDNPSREDVERYAVVFKLVHLWHTRSSQYARIEI